MNFFLHPLSHWRKESDPELDQESDPLVTGTDPDPHQNVTDPQHFLAVTKGLAHGLVSGRSGF